MEIQDDKNSFKALFKHASIGILVTNSKAEIILANDFLLNQFEYESLDLIYGKPIELLIPKRYHHNHVHHRNQYINAPKPRAMGAGIDLFAIKKNGTEFPVEISLSHYQSGNEVFTIAFVIDITLRKESEKAILYQQEQLATFNEKIELLNDELETKVEKRTKQLQDILKELEMSKEELTRALNKEKELSDLKSRFVSMASHEFRTPLSTILSSASLVAKYTETTEQDKRDKHIQRIKSSVNNLISLLNEFLSIGKIEDGKVYAHEEYFNIRELINTLCGEMENLAKTGQQFIYRHTGDVVIYSDPSLLRNVLTNLLSNAIKFSHENGLIEIDCQVLQNQITLIVQDHGIGISDGDQVHLFERFFRGANVTNIQGTGLGLHIIGKYIEILGGKIDFESELEKGTKFIITLNRNNQEDLHQQ